jgi:hypothetical protein
MDRAVHELQGDYYFGHWNTSKPAFKFIEIRNPEGLRTVPQFR